MIEFVVVEVVVVIVMVYCKYYSADTPTETQVRLSSYNLFSRLTTGDLCFDVRQGFVKVLLYLVIHKYTFVVLNVGEMYLTSQPCFQLNHNPLICKS